MDVCYTWCYGGIIYLAHLRALFHLSSCALLEVGFNPFYKSSKLYENIIKPTSLSGSDLGSAIPSPWNLVGSWS